MIDGLNDEGQTLEEWLREVNFYLVKDCFFGIDDLPDYAYFDAFKDNQTSKEIAYEVYNIANKENDKWKI